MAAPQGLAATRAGAGSRWQQGGQVSQAHATCKSRQHVRQVLDGVDAGERAAAEDGVGDCGSAAVCIGAGEEKILARERGPDVQAFDDPVVDGDDAVGLRHWIRGGMPSLGVEE